MFIKQLIFSLRETGKIYSEKEHFFIKNSIRHLVRFNTKIIVLETNIIKEQKKKKQKFVPRTNLCIHNIKGVIYCVASKLLAYVYEFMYTHNSPKDEEDKKKNK